MHHHRQKMCLEVLHLPKESSSEAAVVPASALVVLPHLPRLGAQHNKRQQHLVMVVVDYSLLDQHQHHCSGKQQHLAVVLVVDYPDEQLHLIAVVVDCSGKQQHLMVAVDCLGGEQLHLIAVVVDCLGRQQHLMVAVDCSGSLVAVVRCSAALKQ